MPLEWDAAISQSKFNVSMPLGWDLFSTHGMCGQAVPGPWQVSVCLQHRAELSGTHSSGEATWAFLTGMEQPQAESLLRSETENCSVPAPMAHPEGPSHVAVGIAERLTRPVSGNLSKWSRKTWALLGQVYHRSQMSCYCLVRYQKTEWP